VFRLGDEAFAPIVATLLNEGRNAGEQPGSLPKRKTGSPKPSRFSMASIRRRSMAAGRALAHGLPNGMIFDLTAEQYARDWTLPQFYFHVMIAYAILRSAGVDLGKADYVAHMFAYLRPGTVPGQ
jgi:hypothetical protein